MLDLFKTHIDKNFNYLKNSKLLVCVSGGVDSMVLAEVLNKLRFNIHIAHCNFKLRKNQSDSDQEFVINYAKKNNFPIYFKSFDTKIPKHSTQMAARNLRYNWFQELLKKNNLDYIVTAHHADDNVETFILNLFRSTGLKGLTGIREVNNNIVRPFLIFSKSDIINYAKKNKIIWKEDSSNNENYYLRNDIRNRIIPILSKLDPDISKRINQTINYLKKSNKIINKYIDSIRDENFIKNKDQTLISKKYIRDNHNLVYYLFSSYGFVDSKAIIDFCDSQTGKIIESKTHVLLNNRKFLILKNKSKEINDHYEIGKKGLKSPIKIDIKNGVFNYKTNKNAIYLLKDDLSFPLFLRKFKKGDVFYPTGMKGKKLISKYFKDEKMSIFEKQNQWLLCNNKDVMWIIGKRADRRYAKNTNANIKIEVT